MCLLDYVFRLRLSLLETTALSSIVTSPLFFPTSSEWEFQLLHDIISIWCFNILNSRHSHRCVVIPLCFNLHFPKDKWCWVYFHIWLSICLSLMRCLFRPFAHFFFWIIGLFVLLFSFSIKAYLIHNIILASGVLNSDIIFL